MPKAERVKYRSSSEMKTCFSSGVLGLRKKWRRGKKLGQGAFARVYLAKPLSRSLGNNNTNNNNSYLAVKSSLLSDPFMLCREKLILEKFKDCPYIIRSYGDDATSENGDQFYNVFLEYASGGTLFSHLKGKGLPEYEVKKHAEAILTGLDYIHKKGYAHCDIKPENILLVKKDPSSGCEFTTKIADFGLAKRAGEEIGKNMNGIRGTYMYLAPESLLEKEYEPKVDIWAFGCTVLQMLTGKTPWDKEMEFAAVLFRVAMKKEIPEIPDWVSAEARDFLDKCLVWDPESRWSAEMLLKHPFVYSMANTVYTNTNKVKTEEIFEDMEYIDILIKPYFVLTGDRKRKRMEMLAKEGVEIGVNWLGLQHDHVKKTKMMIPSANASLEIFD